MRKYVLVNEFHEPVMTKKGSYRIFNNRWPIDAAVKVATKNFVYPAGTNQARIYLRDVPAEGQEASSPLVHVFDITRYRETIVDIPKFEGKRLAWVGQAKKVATERLLTRSAVVKATTESSRIEA